MPRAKKPKTKTVSATEARQQLPQLVNTVHRNESRVIIEKSGIPVAALVSASDLERLARFEADWERDFAIVDEIREAFKDVSPDELEREVAKALAEVRAEMRAEKEMRAERENRIA
jgi:prevent-host-death family protein